MKKITRIRKTVATLANRINKKAHDLSASFTRAWQIVKGRIYLTKVAGVTFGNRQKVLKHLAGYVPTAADVTLVREADNQYDSDAVAVHVGVSGSRQVPLGYLPKELASPIAALMDKGLELTARLKSVTGGYGDRPTFGALIEIEL